MPNPDMQPKAKGQPLICPLRQDAECTEACAWRIDGLCAVVMLAEQCGRIGNEQYAMVEMLGGIGGMDPNSVDSNPSAGPAEESE